MGFQFAQPVLFLDGFRRCWWVWFEHAFYGAQFLGEKGNGPLRVVAQIPDCLPGGGSVVFRKRLPCRGKVGDFALVANAEVPMVAAAVFTPAKHGPRVAAEADRVNVTLVTTEVPDFLARCGVPNIYRPIHGAGGQPKPVRRETHCAVNEPAGGLKLRLLGHAVGVPYAHLAVEMCGRQQIAFGRVTNRVHPRVAVGEVVDVWIADDGFTAALSGLSIPKA